MLESAKKEFGIEFVIGQEIEFYLLGGSLLDPQTKRRMPEPIDHSVYCQTGAVDSVAALMDDICEAVESFSIPIEQYHAESGPGQFEIAIAPCTGMQEPCLKRGVNWQKAVQVLLVYKIREIQLNSSMPINSCCNTSI